MKLTIDIPDHILTEFIEANVEVETMAGRLSIENQASQKNLDAAVWNLKAISKRVAAVMMKALKDGIN